MQRFLNFFLFASYLILGSLAYTTYFANAETAQNGLHIASETLSENEHYLDTRSIYSIQEGDTLLSVALEMGIDLQEIYCLLPPNFQKDQPLVIGEKLSPPLPNTSCHRIQEGDTLFSIAENYRLPASSLVDMRWNRSAYPTLIEAANNTPLPAGIFFRVPAVPKDQRTQLLDEELDPDVLALKRLLQEPIVTRPSDPEPNEEYRGSNDERMLDSSPFQQPDTKPMVAMVVGVQSENEQSDNVISGRIPRPPASAELVEAERPLGQAQVAEQSLAIRNDIYPTVPLRLDNDKPEIIGPAPNEWPYGSGEFIWPLQGWLTQDYHVRHRAVDIAAPIGTPIIAVDRGTVTRAGWNEQGYGLFVIVDHNIGYVTLYAHLSEIWVEAGDVVTQGQFLGAVGSTGNSTGPHLHLEVRDFGNRVNPLDFLGQ